MGSESPSNDAADSGNGRASYARANQQARQREAEKKRREREEARALEINKGTYARAENGGSIVRSTSGRGVIAGRSGQMAVESARQEEIDRIYDTPEKKREAAIVDLEARARQTIPGILGAVQRLNINRQLSELKAGGTPQFSLTSSGGFTTTGVMAAGTQGDATPNIPNIGQRTDRAGARSEDGSPQPTRSDAVAPEESFTLASAPSSAARRLLAQSQSGKARRQLYQGIRPSNLA